MTAFFINVYNMLVIHGTVVRGAPTNTAARLAFFDGISYQLGGHEYSANDIEHGVLRGNRPSAWAHSGGEGVAQQSSSAPLVGEK